MHLRPSFASLLASLAACSPAAAQDSAAPEVSTYVPARPLDRRNPVYPGNALSSRKEGWVMLSFVISPAGEVTEPMIEDSSGVEAFENAALRAVEKWTYAPATQDGEAIEQAMVKTRIQFRLQERSEAASPSFVNKYRRIARLIGEGDVAAAEPLIAELEFGERTNLYEDAWFWWAKYVYLSASGSTDAEEMIRSLQRAIGYEEEYLAPDQFLTAAQRLVAMNVQARDMAAAIAAFERLRDAETARRSDDYEEVVASLQPAYDQMLALVNGEGPLVTHGKVREFDYWVHDLWRRSFSVADIAGRLDVLDIRCERGTRRYHSVPLDTVWTIPASWGKCGAYVKGEPGTTFEFREYPRSFVPQEAVDVATPETEAP